MKIELMIKHELVPTCNVLLWISCHQGKYPPHGRDATIPVFHLSLPVNVIIQSFESFLPKSLNVLSDRNQLAETIGCVSELHQKTEINNLKIA